VIRRKLIAAALAGLLAACMQGEGGTEIPNELVGHEFIAGKGPAADAEIKLVPVGYLPGSQGIDSANPVLLTARTDDKGRFAFRDVPPGQYNIQAAQDGLHSFRDSLPVTGKGQDLDPDTLSAPAVLTGRVELEPEDDLQSVTVQALGTTAFVNADADGQFRITNLGAGQYQLRASTILPLYTSDYEVVTLHAGAHDTLARPLRPYYTGIPVVRGLTATPTADGGIRLNWNKPTYKKALAYLIYRDAANVLLPSTVPLWRVTDTAYTDVIYSQTPDSTQFPYQDTSAHAYSYRVKILDASGNVGPSFGFIEATSIPPTVGVSSGKWHKFTGHMPYSVTFYSLFTFRDSLWLMGPPDSSHAPGNPPNSLSVSANGSDWAVRPQPAPLPFHADQITVMRDSLWAIGMISGMDSAKDSVWNGLTLWASADGSHWAQVRERLPMDYRWGFSLIVLRDSLWMLHGNTYDGPSRNADPWHTGDGKTWIRGDAAQDQGFDGATFTAFQDKIVAIGGSTPPIDRRANKSVLISASATEWTAHPAPTGLLPRWNHGAAVHGGKLWVVGGTPAEYYNGSGIVPALSDVWSSEDGIAWKLIDGHAPFQGRANPIVVSWKGKLWVVGGSGPLGSATELWYMDP
jgi:hypothetical protein